MALEIITRNDDSVGGRGNLTVTRDFLEEVKGKLSDNTTALATFSQGQATQAELIATTAALNQKVDGLIKYCEDLEKRMPSGARVFQAGSSIGTLARYEAGRMFTAARRSVRDGQLMEGFRYARAATQVEGTGSAGGVLVPDITQAAVHRVVGEGSIPRKASMNIPISEGTDTMILPTNPNGPSVSYALGNYPAEGNAPSAETGITFGSITLGLKTLMVLDTVSLELKEDALVAIEPLLAQIFGEAVALEENRQAFYSNNPFTGIALETGIAYYYQGNANNSGKTLFEQIAYPDIIGTQFKVKSPVIQRGVWVMSPGSFANIVGLRDTQQRPLYATGWTGGNMPGFHSDGSQPDLAQQIPAILLGRPCFLTEAMPGPTASAASTPYIIYGDMRYHAFGLRKDLQIEWNDSVYFTQGVSAVRLRQRFAMKTIIPACFAVTRTSAT